MIKAFVLPIVAASLNPSDSTFKFRCASTILGKPTYNPDVQVDADRPEEAVASWIRKICGGLGVPVNAGHQSLCS